MIFPKSGEMQSYKLKKKGKYKFGGRLKIYIEYGKQ